MSDQAEERREDNKKSYLSGEIYDWLQCLVAALIVCVLIFVFAFRIIGVKGTSMVPTLQDQDRVVISNLFYTPKQGDIVVLRKDTLRDEPIIKRVIATEGQSVDIDFEKGIVYVDGEALSEDYIASLTHDPEDFTGEVVVPEGSVFVMGDNRNASTDSRSSRLGCVDTRYIMGRLLFRLLPVNEFGKVD